MTSNFYRGFNKQQKQNCTSQLLEITKNFEYILFLNINYNKDNNIYNINNNVKFI